MQVKIIKGDYETQGKSLAKTECGNTKTLLALISILEPVQDSRLGPAKGKMQVQEHTNHWREETMILLNFIYKLMKIIQLLINGKEVREEKRRHLSKIFDKSFNRIYAMPSPVSKPYGLHKQQSNTCLNINEGKIQQF